MASQKSDLQVSFDTALAHHQAGRFAQAIEIYQRVRKTVPDHPELLHLLGIALHQTGRSQEGVELLLRSVAIAPGPVNLCNLGEVLRSLGRLNEAISCLRRSIQMKNDWAESHGNLGQALLDTDQKTEAEKSFNRAAQLAPQRMEYHLRLCIVRKQIDDPHGAVIAGRRAVELAPNLPETWANLALALSAAKKHEEAIDAANRAVEMRPERAEGYVTLGMVHSAAERSDGALTAYRKAIELNPDMGLAHRGIAAIVDSQGQIKEAAAALQKALAIQPRDVEGWVNLSSLLRRLCDYPGSIAAADEAMRQSPNLPAVHGARGFALLSLGDYERGFEEYEWRWRCDNFTTTARQFPAPMWDGSDPAGRTLFVHSEQGFGDVIQFARYVPMLAERGAKIYLEAWPSLRTLLAGVKGATRIIAAGIRPPEFDLHVPLLSLPRIFKTRLDSIPADVPYLSVDPEMVEKWKSKLESAPAGRRIGLVWAGNVSPDPERTCPLEFLAPLAQVPGISLISLQKREASQAKETMPAGMKLFDVSSDLKDFSETAGAMMNLDLIITIDTASAHLAGALGRPTWTLIPWAPDWRWLGRGERTPWYPTMRLFRQPEKGDWASVVQRLVDEFSKHFPSGA